VTSFDSGSGRDPIDPDFAGLFRPDDDPARSSDDDDAPHFEPIVDPVVDPRDEPDEQDEHAAAAQPDAADDAESGQSPVAVNPEPVVVPADPIADTGRLFRSQGVAGHDEAMLALAADRAGRLRTLERRDDAVLADAGPVVSLDDDPLSAPATPEDVVKEKGGRRVGRRARPAEQGHRARGITGGAVYLIVIGVTVLVGFANALLAGGAVGWPTGVALLISSVYAALTVRRQDDVVAIIVPPVAFLVAALTAGQLFIGSAEGSLLNRAVVAFFTLADNWFWILGATAAALVIVLVRRRRG
jgi:hypothetical protein